MKTDTPVDMLTDPRCLDVNTVTGALKSYLRELENPLLTFERYDAIMEIAKNQDEQQQLQQLKGLIIGLPKGHYDTLKFLITHLRKYDRLL